MQIQDFEKKIQKEIDSELSIRPNPNADDIAGVYWKDLYISVALPPQEIREVYSKDYTDKMGAPYRSIDMAMDHIKAKLTKFQDPENYKIMTQ